jgi:hypothetical protein
VPAIIISSRSEPEAIDVARNSDEITLPLPVSFATASPRLGSVLLARRIAGKIAQSARQAA